MARQPLFGAARMELRILGRAGTGRVLVLDLHEIAAGKIVALFDRGAARDLFDVQRILVGGATDDEPQAVVVVRSYGRILASGESAGACTGQQASFQGSSGAPGAGTVVRRMPVTNTSEGTP